MRRLGEPRPRPSRRERPASSSCFEIVFARRLGRLAVAGEPQLGASPRRVRPPVVGPARRPVGRARRVARVGHGHRRARSPSAGHDVEAWLIDLDGRWWWLPAGHRRDGRAAAPPTTTRRRSARDGPAERRRGARPPRGARPAAGRVHRAARAVRRGRHGPGAARGGRAGLHRRRRRGLGARHGQGAVQALWPRAGPAGRALARGPARRDWAADRARGRSAQLEAFAAGCRRPAPDGQAGPARLVASGCPSSTTPDERAGGASTTPSGYDDLALVEALPRRARASSRWRSSATSRPTRGLRAGRDRPRPRVLRLRGQVHARPVARRSTRAELDGRQRERIREARARRVPGHRRRGLRARRLPGRRRAAVLSEINTIPGFTPISLFPTLPAEAARLRRDLPRASSSSPLERAAAAPARAPDRADLPR